MRLNPKMPLEDLQDIFTPFEKTASDRHRLKAKNAFQKRSCSCKLRFRDEEEAKNHVKIWKNKEGTNPLRIYYCSFCNGYHTTKQVNQERIALRQRSMGCKKFARITTEESAKEQVAFLQKHFGDVRYYFCFLCKGYHIVPVSNQPVEQPRQLQACA